MGISLYITTLHGLHSDFPLSQFLSTNQRFAGPWANNSWQYENIGLEKLTNLWFRSLILDWYKVYGT